MRSVVLVLLCVAWLVSGCDQQNEFIPPPPPTVTIASPVEETYTVTREFTGRTEATETVEIRARVQGFLEAVEFRDGDIVEAGDVLFRLEREPFEAALASAIAERDRAQASLDLAEAVLDRTELAAKSKAVSELEVLEKRAERDVAEANRKAAEAAVAQAELDLSYTVIHAPIGGRLSRRYVDVGNLVGAGESTLLTTLVADNPIFVYFNVDERRVLDFLRTRPAGGPTAGRRADPPRVTLFLADGVEYPSPGEITFAENVVNPDTGTVTVRATFENDEELLYPGLFARVSVPMDEKRGLLVPQVALQRDQAGWFVLAVDGEGVVYRRDVELGPRQGPRRVVLSGLAADDRVIVRGVQRARPGSRVNAVEQGTQEGVGARPADADVDADVDAGAGGQGADVEGEG